MCRETWCQISDPPLQFCDSSVSVALVPKLHIRKKLYTFMVWYCVSPHSIKKWKKFWKRNCNIFCIKGCFSIVFLIVVLFNQTKLGSERCYFMHDEESRNHANVSISVARVIMCNASWYTVATIGQAVF